MADRILPLPDILRCAGPDCTATIRSADLPERGWTVLAGRPLCAEHTERARLGVFFDAVNAEDLALLDGIDQGEPDQLPEVDLVDLRDPEDPS